MKVSNLLKIFRLLLYFLVAWFRPRNDLALENLALGQQLATFKHEQPRPKLANADRCHLTLGKDTPVPRSVRGLPSKAAQVVPLPRVGGLYHRYQWRDAA